MKKIILIPPDGTFQRRDYSLYRIAKWLKNNGINTTLLYIEKEFLEIDTRLFDSVVKKENLEDIVKHLEMHSYDKILHRSWMHSYDFSALLVEKFENVIINIKDWNFAPKNVYEFLFPNSADHVSIEYIFQNAELILSHFTQEQSLLWAKEYKTDSSKFITFPEYCNSASFNEKPFLAYENIKLVYAGVISPTVYNEDYFPNKAHLRSIKKLTKEQISIDFVMPEPVYEKMYTSEYFLYHDFMYEHEFNKYFSLVKGKILDASILNQYHFGFSELETSGLNHDLYKYAITSKFAFYLEAGLPILINKKFVSIARLVEKYQLGIVFSNDDLDYMTKVLSISQSKYDSFVENIAQYRKKFTYSAEQLEIIFEKRYYESN